jgi:multiple sugar transport system permease protein
MTSQSAALVTPEVSKKQPRVRTLEQTQRRWGWIFLSPWIIGFLAFTLFPMVASLYFSFTDFQVGKPIQWVGLKNWNDVFNDPITVQSLGITLRFGIFVVPFTLGAALLLATLLNSRLLVGRPFLRVLFYMPYIIPAISVVFIWQSFLNGDTGWLNRLLRAIGIANPPNWISDAQYIYTGLVMIALWGIGNAILTMMAGMQGVPTELYEAAEVDGASYLLRWWRITLPMISPVIFYNLVLSVIAVMQYFTVPYVLSGTARNNAAFNFINLHLYRTAFTYQQMGYASALAWFLFVVALAITVALFATSRRWVYYASGD